MIAPPRDPGKPKRPKMVELKINYYQGDYTVNCIEPTKPEYFNIHSPKVGITMARTIIKVYKDIIEFQGSTASLSLTKRAVDSGLSLADLIT